MEQTIQLMIDNDEPDIQYFLQFYVDLIDKQVPLQQHSQIMCRISKLTKDFTILQKYLRLLEKQKVQAEKIIFEANRIVKKIDEKI